MKTRDKDAIKTAPSYLRVVNLPAGKEIQVDREAGVMRNVAVATVGEAEGHNAWLDQAFLNQLKDQGNRSPGGMKARFTHPRLSGDGLGTQIGSFHNFAIGGNKLTADLHFLETSNNLPRLGNVRDHLFELAERKPDDLGASIAIQRDMNQESQFRKEHSSGSNLSAGFKSPDPKNKKNYDHWRLKKMRAVDLVGEPAANPDGLFSGEQSEVPTEADEVMLFAIGASEIEPDPDFLGVHPDRMKIYLDQFKAAHRVQLLEWLGVTEDVDQLEIKTAEFEKAKAAAELSRMAYEAKLGELEEEQTQNVVDDVNILDKADSSEISLEPSLFIVYQNKPRPSAGTKKERGLDMTEEKKLGIDQLTIEFLQERRPDLVQALLSQGRNEEVAASNKALEDERGRCEAIVREGCQLAREVGELKQGSEVLGLVVNQIADGSSAKLERSGEGKDEKRVGRGDAIGDLKMLSARLLTGTNPDTPGPDEPTDDSQLQREGGKKYPDTEEGWKQEWAQSEDLQAEFRSEGAYLAFRKADKAGKVKVLKRTA